MVDGRAVPAVIAVSAFSLRSLTRDTDVLGTRPPCAQVPFLLHLDVSKLVLDLMSDPVSQGSQPLRLFLCQPSLPKPPPPASPWPRSGLAGKAQWFYEEEGLADKERGWHLE